MALLASQQVAITGSTVTFAPATVSGDTVKPDERAVLEVKNTSGSPVNVTIAVPGTTYGQANPDVTVAVPATTGHVRIGPLDKGLADPATGNIAITYPDGVTNVTVAVVRH